MDKAIKRIWLKGLLGLAIAFNLGTAVALFSGNAENATMCLIIWLVTELYISLFGYINIFAKNK